MIDDFYNYLDSAIVETSEKYNISNLIILDKQDRYNGNENGYWRRISKLSFFNKLMDSFNYHFLYEIQGLSSRIHFGIASSLLFRDKANFEGIRPAVYNHRYTFMIESSIHGIYAFWNRVALVMNTYLKKEFIKERVYFSKVVKQIKIDYPELSKSAEYEWAESVRLDFDILNRNEFAHNNSLLMQNFWPYGYPEKLRIDLYHLPDLLLTHNNYIVSDIDKLVELLESLDNIEKNVV